MPVIPTAADRFKVGERMSLEGRSPEKAHAVVFEDDGETGYLYALEPERGGNPIVDAMHIYNVSDVADKDDESEIMIGWSEDSDKAVLLINGYPHAIFDFSHKHGWCRTGFPAPDPGGGWRGHAWDDAAKMLFA